MIYVTQLRPCKPARFWRFPQFCHLVADSRPELAGFADKLRLSFRWFSDNPVPCYKLSALMHSKALHWGAREIDNAEAQRLVERLQAEEKAARRAALAKRFTTENTEGTEKGLNHGS
jgi:hypothetical protein